MKPRSDDAQDLPIKMKRTLLDLYCDACLLPQNSTADRRRKVNGMAELIGIAEELVYYLTDFRKGIECRLRLMERGESPGAAEWEPRAPLST